MIFNKLETIFMHQKTSIHFFIRRGLFSLQRYSKKYLYFATIRILIHISHLYETYAKDVDLNN